MDRYQPEYSNVVMRDDVTRLTVSPEHYGQPKKMNCELENWCEAFSLLLANNWVCEAVMA